MPHSLRTTFRAAFFVVAVAVVSCQSDPGSLLDEGGSPGDANLRRDIHSESGGGGGGGIAPPPVVQTCTNQTIQAAQMLLSHVPISEESRVLVVGPVPAGTLLVPASPDSVRTPALQVASGTDTYYAFWIDDAPGAKYSHPTRYAWIGLAGGSHAAVGAEWPLELMHAQLVPARYEAQANFTIGSIRFTCAQGTGASSFSGNWVSRLKETAVGIQGKAGNTPEKKALVFDAGDRENYFETYNSYPWFHLGDISEECARDAGLIRNWLGTQGFGVQRISQSWGNTLPALKDDSMNKQLKDIITSYAEYFRDSNLPPGQCHEFFLYLGGHGVENKFCIFRSDGSGRAEQLYYDLELKVRLARFPTNVKLIVFIDACHSGSAIDDLMSLCAERSCGVTVVTSCGANQTCPSGSALSRDSATEDFAEGENENLDGDNKVGDFGDRWLKMSGQGNGSSTPQRALCPGQTTMCSTD